MYGPFLLEYGHQCHVLWGHSRRTRHWRSQSWTFLHQSSCGKWIKMLIIHVNFFFPTHHVNIHNLQRMFLVSKLSSYLFIGIIVKEPRSSGLILKPNWILLLVYLLPCIYPYSVNYLYWAFMTSWPTPYLFFGVILEELTALDFNHFNEWKRNLRALYSAHPISRVPCVM